MEIGIYINNKWEAAILTITDFALIFKCQSKSVIITFKEIVYNRIEEDSFIHLGYIERINGDAHKKDICINGNNNQDILNNIENNKNNVKNIENDVYIPPVNNVYNNNSVLNGNYVNNNSSVSINKQEIDEEKGITQENIQKQNEMNKKYLKQENKLSYLFLIFIGVLIFLIVFYFIKTISLNISDNLITGGGEMWRYSQSSDIFAYQFKSNNKCKYIHKTTRSIIENNCNYNINKHKLIINLETGQTQTYEWNIKYKFQFSKENLVNTVLYLKGENKQEFKKTDYNFDK